MGCCSSKHELVLTKPEEYFSQLVKKSLSSHFQSYDIDFFSNLDISDINKPLLQVGEIKTNALGVSILISDFHLMKYLTEIYQASFHSLEEQLSSQNISLMEFLILNFNPEIFKYYLPIHLSQESKNDVCLLDETLQFASLRLPKSSEKVHPMRYATQIGNIPFLSFILFYFKGKFTPSCFDIHDVDEETGENCALVACAEGNLEMISFLFKNKCDFKIKNKCKENAINLALANMRESDDCEVLAVVKFLVDTARCDLSDNYEESLMLSRHKCVSEFIEENLKGFGIFTTKECVEAKYKSSFNECNFEKNLDVDIISLPSIINSVSYSDSSNC
jgi:hypothetical protein